MCTSLLFYMLLCPKYEPKMNENSFADCSAGYRQTVSGGRCYLKDIARRIAKLKRQKETS